MVSALRSVLTYKSPRLNVRSSLLSVPSGKSTAFMNQKVNQLILLEMIPRCVPKKRLILD